MTAQELNDHTEEPNPVIAELTGIDPEQYGDAHAQHCLEIYTLCVEMADRVSSRRQTANTFFLSINSLITGGLGYGQIYGVAYPFLIILAAAGVISCILWWQIIKSAKNLNSAKFTVIHHMEDMLPLRPYRAEWRWVARGKKSRLYKPMTKVELCIPIAFILLYGVLGILALTFDPLPHKQQPANTDAIQHDTN